MVLDELHGRHISNRTVRPLLIIFPPPGFNHDLRLLQARIQENDEVLAKRKELIEKLDAKIQEADRLRASIDPKLAEAQKLIAIGKRYDEDMKKAAVAAKENRRIAPVGEYNLMVEYPSDPTENLELVLLCTLTNLECLADGKGTDPGKYRAHQYKGVTKEYAVRMGERFRTVGAKVSIEKLVPTLGPSGNLTVHERFNGFVEGKTDWFGTASSILHSTDGVPGLTQELSCQEKKRQELAQIILDLCCIPLDNNEMSKKPAKPTDAAGWTRWWNETGKNIDVKQLWHNFDSHYQYCKNQFTR